MKLFNTLADGRTRNTKGYMYINRYKYKHFRFNSQQYIYVLQKTDISQRIYITTLLGTVRTVYEG